MPMMLGAVGMKAVSTLRSVEIGIRIRVSVFGENLGSQRKLMKQAIRAICTQTLGAQHYSYFGPTIIEIICDLAVQPDLNSTLRSCSLSQDDLGKGSPQHELGRPDRSQPQEGAVRERWWRPTAGQWQGEKFSQVKWWCQRRQYFRYTQQ